MNKVKGFRFMAAVVGLALMAQVAQAASRVVVLNVPEGGAVTVTGAGGQSQTAGAPVVFVISEDGVIMQAFDLSLVRDFVSGTTPTGGMILPPSGGESGAAGEESEGLSSVFGLIIDLDDMGGIPDLGDESYEEDDPTPS